MIWKTIPNFSHYEVSEYGDVRRHANIKISKEGYRKKPGELLTPTKTKYPCFRLLSDDGKIIRKKLSHLVLSAFKGPRLNSAQHALHWDDNQDNNHWKNLRWGTSEDNGVDAIRNKSKASGTANGSSKLTDAMVLKARKDYANGMTLHQLVEKYGMTLTPIWAAVTGRSWKHLPGAVLPKGQGARTDLNGKYA